MVEGKEIKLTIDGNEVTVKQGSTVLEAAREADVFVPTLCNHPDLPPYGACRMCICQIEGMRGFPTSCTVPATDGMKVSTDNDKVKDLRKEVLTLLLEKHPHACLTCAQREGCTRDPCSSNVPVDERCCAKFGNCELQAIVEHVGIRDDTPKYVHKGAKVFEDEPLVSRDYNLCILCGRCVQACNDLRGIGVLGFIKRGHDAEVRTAFDAPLMDSDCMFCTSCVEVCPTGTLLDKDLDKGARDDILVPCKSKCPAGVDIPRFIHHILKDEIAQAAAVIYERIPLPRLIGQHCDHPCEGSCRRDKVNEALSIRALEKFAVFGSGDLWSTVKMPTPTGKKVAVKGSGPTGLGAAYFLAMKGHGVTVFGENGETIDKLTTMIGQGPDGTTVEQEMEALKAIGINFETGEPQAQGFDTVMIAEEDSGLAQAMAKARELAGSTDTKIGGNGDMDLKLVEKGDPDPIIGRVRGFADLPRESQGLDKETAAKESRRCLRCDLRLTIGPVPTPPDDCLSLTQENIAAVPETEGVYTLMDGDKTILAIKGVDNLAQALKEKLDDPGDVAYFEYEEDKMFSKRENEMLQQYMQIHGKMPEGAGGDDDLDDLF